jgi:Helix-turn-helix domain
MTAEQWRHGVRIGEALAGARRQADLTVTEVSERTRIRETIIRAIEDDDYSVCGGDFYARGHIRSIAKVVGTDPELLIRDYDAVHRAPGALSTVSLEELLASATEAPQRRGPDWAAGQERAAAARASLRRWPSLAAALAVLTGTTVRRWLSQAGELAVLTGTTVRRWLSQAEELAVLTWTTVRLRLSRSALWTAAAPALRRARHRLNRSAALGLVAAALGLVAAVLTTVRLALSRSLRRGLNRPAVRKAAARHPGGRHGLNWSVALGIALLAALGFGIYHLVSGSQQAVAPSAASQPAVTGQPVRDSGPHPAPKTSPAPAAPSPAAAAPVQQLVPVRAEAFGPRGGDHPQLASHVIGVHRAAGWHTDWYSSARFGNLYGGTGLLLDMGRPVTLTAAQITLGRARGASLQVRIGASPALAAMAPVAHAADTGGVVRLQLTRPAHGRYVLIWFTKLPPDSAGTFRANVYHVSLKGRTH